MPFTGAPTVMSANAAATSSEEIGCTRAGERRTVCPTVADWAMPPTNSKNWVARTIGIGNPGGLDQPLLGELGAKVATVLQALGTDDRQRNMMAHPGSGFRREQVAARGLEELQSRLILERRRIRHVDDNLRV